MPVFTSALLPGLMRDLAGSTRGAIAPAGSLRAGAGHGAEPLMLHHARMLHLTHQTGSALYHATIIVSDGKIAFADLLSGAPAIASAREIDATACRADIALLACGPSNAIGCTRHVRGVVSKGAGTTAQPLTRC